VFHVFCKIAGSSARCIEGSESTSKGTIKELFFMDMKSRRRFVNSMMAATAMAMGGPMLIGQDYTPMGGVQMGPDGQNGNPPPGPIGGSPMGQAGAPGAPAGARRGGGAGGGAPRVPRPKPAGIYWISGTGTERLVPSWDIKEHTKVTMDNVKNGVERMGGTMDSFLYMQVFFCLRNDDGTPKPTGSAANAAYQKAYTDLTDVYNSYFTGGSRPPRSCFALTWIPGNSLIEISAAAWIDPSIVPPPAPPRAPRAAAPAAPPA
jgi:enamine deaminase RidA (YjgF/YER057c/UK114 family)